MKQTKGTPIQLLAEDGHYLTQAADVAPVDRIVTTAVTLASNDSATAWREIPAAEGGTIRTEQRKVLDQFTN